MCTWKWSLPKVCIPQVTLGDVFEATDWTMVSRRSMGNIRKGHGGSMVVTTAPKLPTTIATNREVRLNFLLQSVGHGAHNFGACPDRLAAPHDGSSYPSVLRKHRQNAQNIPLGPAHFKFARALPSQLFCGCHFCSFVWLLVGFLQKIIAHEFVLIDWKKIFNVKLFRKIENLFPKFKIVHKLKKSLFKYKMFTI